MAKKKTRELLNIVIPNYNAFDLLEECLKSIPDAVGDVSYGVTIVDNGSKKEDADAFYKNLNSNIRVIRNKENLGFPKACNMGVMRKASPLIFFLNSDIVLDPGSVNTLVKYMDNPEMGIVGMFLRFPDDLDDPIRPSGKVQHVGMGMNITGHPVHLFVGWSRDNPRIQSVKDQDLFAVTGAAMMTRRKIFRKVGGFNEIYGQGTYEDIEYCLTISNMGYKIRVCLDATATHFTGGSAHKNQTGFPLKRNRLTFLHRWAGVLVWDEWKYL